VKGVVLRKIVAKRIGEIFSHNFIKKGKTISAHPQLWGCAVLLGSFFGH
jgi:hypothetical protein